jgi:hypothetical protein
MDRVLPRRVWEEEGEGDGCFSRISLTCGPSRSDDSPPMVGRHVRDGTRRLVEPTVAADLSRVFRPRFLQFSVV